jgi:hydrogenase maturation protease
LLIAVGNPLRGDDGVAHRVLELLGPEVAAEMEVETRSVLQLTPELAAEMAGFESVVFLDAAVDSRSVTIREVPGLCGPASLTHVSRPSEIVALATKVFGFKGRALQCRIPVDHLDAGEGLSAQAESFAREAAGLLIKSQIQPRYQ